MSTVVEALLVGRWCIATRQTAVRRIGEVMAISDDIAAAPVKPGPAAVVGGGCGALPLPPDVLGSGAWLRALVDLSPDAIFVILDGYHAFANTRGLDLLGARTLADLRTRPASEFMHPDCRDVALTRMHRMVGEREALPYVEECVIRLDGRTVDIEAAGTPIDVGGRPAALVVVRDITARKQAESELRQAQRRFHAAFSHAPSAILIADRNGTVVATNPPLGRLLGGVPDLAGRPCWTIAVGDQQDQVRQHYLRLADGAFSAMSGDVRFVRADGSVGWANARAAWLSEEQLSIIHLVDVSAARQAERDLTDRARHDPLTGLANRTFVLDRIGEALDEDDGDLAVLFADLDGFKAVNDRYGHHVGDQVLVAVARRMRGAVPAGDLVGRIGGDEFAIVLIGRESARQASQIADRMHLAVSRPVAVGRTLLRVGVSVGIATATVGTDVSAQSLLAAADAAMYRSKALARVRRAQWSTTGSSSSATAATYLPSARTSVAPRVVVTSVPGAAPGASPPSQTTDSDRPAAASSAEPSDESALPAEPPAEPSDGPSVSRIRRV